MHKLAERIIAGDIPCPHEILEDNASRIIARQRAWEVAGTHTSKECNRGKNCTHGPLVIDTDYAATLVNRAQVECTCGHYTKG